jgi:hypothetical protein
MIDSLCVCTLAATEVLAHQMAKQLTPAFQLIGTAEWLAPPPTSTHTPTSAAAAAGARVSTAFSRLFEQLFDAHMELLDPYIPKAALKGKLASIVQVDCVSEYFTHFTKAALSAASGKGGCAWAGGKSWADALRSVSSDVKAWKQFFKDFPHTPNAQLSAVLEPMDALAGLYEG